MKWLTRIGGVVLKVSEILTGVGPLLTSVNPKAAPIVQTVVTDLQRLEAVIVQVEIFGQALGLPGAEKLKGAAPAVAQILLESAKASGHDIEDQALFLRGATKIADGLADCLNARHA